MELRDVRYFAAVADEGSFVKAAARLRLAQPALSRQVRDLEREVGAQLLTRGRRGVTLTTAGANILPTCESLLHAVQTTVTTARLADTGHLGACRLGIGRFALLNDVVARGLRLVRERFPYLRLDATEMFMYEQVSALEAGTIDLGIAVEPGDTPGLSRETLYEDVIDSAIIPENHPAAYASSVSIDELRGLPLILPRIPLLAPVMERAEAALRELGAPLAEGSPSLDRIYGLVSIGRAWTTGIRSQCTDPPAGTTVVPLTGLRVPFLVVMLWITQNRARTLHNVIGAFREARDGRPKTRAASGEALVVANSDTTVANAECAARSIELRHLNALVAAVEERSLGRAAQRLGLTQPALSRRISELERAIGVRLLERSVRGVEATAAGDALRTKALGMLTLANEIVIQARRAERGVRGRCVLGVVPAAITHGFVARLLERLEAEFPDVELSVSEIPTPRLAGALLTREIDLAIGHAYPGLIESSAITGVRLLDDVLDRALLSSEHPLASQPRIVAADLRDVPLLFMSREFHPTFYDSVMGAFARIGLKPRVDATFDGLRTVWALAARGLGWSLGSRSQRGRPPLDLVGVPIDGFTVPWGLEALWRVDETSDAVQAALWILREQR